MRRRVAPRPGASVRVGSESDFSDRSVGRHPCLTAPCLCDAHGASRVRRPSGESAACQTRRARRPRRQDPFVQRPSRPTASPSTRSARTLNGRGPIPTPMRRSARLESRVRRCARPMRLAPVVLGFAALDHRRRARERCSGLAMRVRGSPRRPLCAAVDARSSWAAASLGSLRRSVMEPRAEAALSSRPRRAHRVHGLAPG